MSCKRWCHRKCRGVEGYLGIVAGSLRSKHCTGVCQNAENKHGGHGYEIQNVAGKGRVFLLLGRYSLLDANRGILTKKK